jgi:hypothetical protein
VLVWEFKPCSRGGSGWIAVLGICDDGKGSKQWTHVVLRENVLAHRQLNLLLPNQILATGGRIRN